MSALRTPAEQLFFEGNRILGEGDFARAERCFRAALAQAPDFAAAHANLALVRERCGALEEALHHYRQALALHPDSAQTHLNFGALLVRTKQFDQAETAFLQALRLTPHAPAPWSGLGVLLACLQREEEAEQAYRRALELDPHYRQARFNLSYLLLRQGRLAEGWPLLEARPLYAPLQRYFECPRWQGEPLAGKRIVIAFEGGHGDMIQFARYAAELKARGAAHVAILCDPALCALFGTLRGADAVYSHQAPMETAGWDFWTLPMSLPLHCQTRLETIPAAIPYLAAEPARIAHWAAQLAPPAGTPAHALRVGLCWQGNRLFENDGDRSFASPAPFAALAAQDGVHWISLQKDAGDADRAGLAMTMLGARLGDFADTAAVIAQLDLVISVDTAVAHLAGSLGKRCWLLLPAYRPDWRWLDGRDDSPWYPGTHRLFRQRVAGDWNEPLARLGAALRELATAQAGAAS